MDYILAIMMKYLTCILFLLIASDGFAAPSATEPRHLVSLSDKAGNIYDLQRIGITKHGIYSADYILRKRGSQEHILKISTIQDVVSGGCGRGLEIGLESSIVVQDYIVKDINKDGFLDLVLFIEEVDCVLNHTADFLSVVALATSDGFDVYSSPK